MIRIMQIMAYLTLPEYMACTGLYKEDIFDEEDQSILIAQCNKRSLLATRHTLVEATK